MNLAKAFMFVGSGVLTSIGIIKAIKVYNKCKNIDVTTMMPSEILAINAEKQKSQQLEEIES